LTWLKINHKNKEKHILTPLPLSNDKLSNDIPLPFNFCTTPVTLPMGKKDVPFPTLLITGVLTLMPLVSKPNGVLVIVLKLESFPID